MGHTGSHNSARHLIIAKGRNKHAAGQRLSEESGHGQTVAALLGKFNQPKHDLSDQLSTRSQSVCAGVHPMMQVKWMKLR